MWTKQLKILYVASDFLASVVAWTLFCLLRNNIKIVDGTIELTSLHEYIIGIIILPVFWVILFMITGFYDVTPKRSRLVELVNSLLITIPGIFIIFIFLVIHGSIKDNSSFLFLLETLFLFQFILTYIPRLIITSSTAKKVHQGLIGFNTVIIGSNGKALELYNKIKGEKIAGGNILIGYVSINEKSAGLMQDFIPYLGPFANLPQIIAENKVEEVIIAIEGDEHNTLKTIINVLEYSDVSIKAIPSLYDILTGRVKLTSIFGTPLIEISNRLMPAWQANFKQIMDYAGAFLSLILLTPAILILVILIRLSGKGPVIYSQERVGKNGKPFMIYKFRSMQTDAEHGKPLLSGSNENRVTDIGRFMRKHRLDEIPNFINVLKGEMSLVGPRPERQFFIDQIVKKAPHYHRLHKVKPGITSWGQVKYGYASNVDEMTERLDYDLLYLENMSIFIDMKIIIYTLRIIIKGEGV